MCLLNIPVYSWRYPPNTLIHKLEENLGQLYKPLSLLSSRGRWEKKWRESSNLPKVCHKLINVTGPCDSFSAIFFFRFLSAYERTATIVAWIWSTIVLETICFAPHSVSRHVVKNRNMCEDKCASPGAHYFKIVNLTYKHEYWHILFKCK